MQFGVFENVIPLKLVHGGVDCVAAFITVNEQSTEFREQSNSNQDCNFHSSIASFASGRPEFICRHVCTIAIWLVWYVLPFIDLCKSLFRNSLSNVAFIAVFSLRKMYPKQIKKTVVLAN